MRLWMILIAFLLALPADATLSPYGQAENRADPASCGSTACPTHHAALSAFPYWERQIVSHGDENGPVWDGSYIYLGTVGGFGYSISSDHTGGENPNGSVRFLQGDHAGKHYRITDLVISGSQSFYDGAPGNPFDQGPHIQQLEAMQYAPGCEEAGQAASGAEACCDGYDLGDGTCSASGAGDACDSSQGGCVTDALPTLPLVALATREDLVVDSTLLLTWGQGDRSSVAREWYLECTTPTARGGTGSTPDACCSVSGTRLEYTLDPASGQPNDSIFRYSNSYFGGYPTGIAGTASDRVIGGIGHNCDTFGGGPGYTYLGPVAEGQATPHSSLAWSVATFQGWKKPTKSLFRTGIFTGVDHSLPKSDGVTQRCWAGYSTTATSSTLLSDHLEFLEPPLPRNGARADCGGVISITNDSGSPVFAYVGSTWRFVGPSSSGNFAGELMYGFRWLWWQTFLGRKLGGVR